MNTLVLNQFNGVGNLKGYLKTADVAKRFDVNQRTILRWIKDGCFPGAIKKNPRSKNSPILIPEQSVEQFAQEQVIKPDVENGDGNDQPLG